MAREVHDVFLSYNRSDRAAVFVVDLVLRRRGIRPWLDLRDLTPGQSWQEELEAVIETVPAAAVFVGWDGLGPWEDQETRACLDEFTRRRLRVVPVLLPGAPEEPELPLFLRRFTRVDLRDGITDAGIDRLVWGITGERPEPAYPDAKTRELSLTLQKAQRRKALLESDGQDTTAVVEEILDLKRRLREGARLRAGDFLDGRFELLETVGSGGFAHVWKAYDQDGQATVAVKVLHPQYAEDKTRRERFFRGARKMARLARLGSPGIVNVLEEQAEDGGFHFFVMEYVGGGDFRQAVLSGRLSVEDRIRVILEVGEALELAHNERIFHRDVKPANILLGGGNRPKLTDFDLVRAFDTTGGTRTSSMLGTFLFAAPEAMLNAKETDKRADVYSLGMTALFALHGADLPPDLPWDLPGFLKALNVSEGCRQAVTRAVSRDVDQRWASVAEFCDALRTTSTLVEIDTKDKSEMTHAPGGEFQSETFQLADGGEYSKRLGRREQGEMASRLRASLPLLLTAFFPGLLLSPLFIAAVRAPFSAYGLTQSQAADGAVQGVFHSVVYGTVWVFTITIPLLLYWILFERDGKPDPRLNREWTSALVGGFGGLAGGLIDSILAASVFTSDSLILAGWLEPSRGGIWDQRPSFPEVLTHLFFDTRFGWVNPISGVCIGGGVGLLIASLGRDQCWLDFSRKESAAGPLKLDLLRVNRILSVVVGMILKKRYSLWLLALPLVGSLISYGLLVPGSGMRSDYVDLLLVRGLCDTLTMVSGAIGLSIGILFSFIVDAAGVRWELNARPLR